MIVSSRIASLVLVAAACLIARSVGDGDTFVFEAGDAYTELAKNSLGEMSFATPAADAESLSVRTRTKLYRIAATPQR